jgi:hypothetical protein
MGLLLIGLILLAVKMAPGRDNAVALMPSPAHKDITKSRLATAVASSYKAKVTSLVSAKAGLVKTIAGSILIIGALITVGVLVTLFAFKPDNGNNSISTVDDEDLNTVKGPSTSGGPTPGLVAMAVLGGLVFFGMLSCVLGVIFSKTDSSTPSSNTPPAVSFVVGVVENESNITFSANHVPQIPTIKEPSTFVSHGFRESTTDTRSCDINPTFLELVTITRQIDELVTVPENTPSLQILQNSGLLQITELGAIPDSHSLHFCGLHSGTFRHFRFVNIKNIDCGLTRAQLKLIAWTKLREEHFDCIFVPFDTSQVILEAGGFDCECGNHDICFMFHQLGSEREFVRSCSEPNKQCIKGKLVQFMNTAGQADPEWANLIGARLQEIL